MQSFEMNQLHSIATILLSLILGTNAFSYKDAKNWGKKYPQCDGKNQSPIMLKPTGLHGFPKYERTLQCTDFQKLPEKLTIKNTGHTVEMRADWSGEPPRLTGGPLNGNYVLEKTTFHWAPKRSVYGPSDLSFNNLERNLLQVQSPNSSAEIPPFRFASILDDRIVPFAFYEGSLDYPPCSESVTWFIDDSAHGITDGLINELGKIRLHAGDVSNVRPHQALNKRQVKVVYNHEKDYKEILISSQ